MSKKISQLTELTTVLDTDFFAVVNDGETKKVTKANLFQDVNEAIDDLNTLLSGKSNIGHIHDDRYYTETEVDDFLSGIGGLEIGGLITGATQGSVLFAGPGGVLAQDNTNFYRDPSTGNLGIGTNTFSDPITGNSKLQVVDGPTTLSFRDHGGQGWVAISSSANSITGFIGHLNTTDGFTTGSFTNHPFTLRTNNTNRWQISEAGHLLASADNTYDIGASGATRPRNIYVGTNGLFAGKVGIGTSPAAKLHLVDSVAANAWFIGGTGSSAYSQMVFGEDTSGNTYSEFIRYSNAHANAGMFQLINYGKPVWIGSSNSLPSLYARLGATLDVGIGTDDPQGLFHIAGSTASQKALIVQAAASQTGNLTEWQNSSETALTVVDKIGRIGIGTSAPGTINNVTNAETLLNVVGNIEMKRGGAVSFSLTDTSQTTNKKIWQFLNSGSSFIIRRLNDNIAAATTRLTLLDTGELGLGAITPTAKLDIDSDILRLRTAKTPATAGASGNQGDICWDSNYLYVCTSVNAWKRSPLSSW